MISRTRLYPLALILMATGATCQAADPAYYLRQDTWQNTVQTSREALTKFEAEQAAKPEPSALHEGVALGVWYQLGPFVAKKDAFKESFPPEQEIDLEKSYEKGKLRWTRRPQYTDGVPHSMSAPTQGATYLYRTITADKAQTLTGYFGSDDGLTVWLNGERILAHDVPRGYGPNQDKAPLKLKAGENQLLLKVNNHAGGHGYYFHTDEKPVKGDPKTDPRQILWELARRDFKDASSQQQMKWEEEDGVWKDDWKPGDVTALAKRYASKVRLAPLAEEAKRLAPQTKDLKPIRVLYYRSRTLDAAAARLRSIDFAALRRAIDDLSKSFPETYRDGAKYLARLAALEQSRNAAVVSVTEAKDGSDDAAVKLAGELEKLRLEALLANPLLDFDKLLCVKRKANNLGLPANWQGNDAIGKAGYDNEIAVLSPLAPTGALTTLYKPDGGKFVGDLDLHFTGSKLLFSMPGNNGRWQVFEIGTDGQGLRQVSRGDQADVDNFDACYLPDGRIVFCSNACFQGVPCVGGSNYVSLLYVMDPDGGNVHQLTFDQDHSWDPFVLNNGKVLYGRWEYSDTPHYFTRLLMSMNPDGTEQMNYYGSNSYWPNSLFYARPVPNDPYKFVGVISGHHGVRRMGELVLFDPSRGRHEVSGAVQKIPGYGKPVQPIITDQLVNNSWPKFLHPWPLSDKYFLVSCQETPDAPWGLYLVDVFDNLLPLRFEPGYALLEPVPLRARLQPPVIRDKVQRDRDDALVYLENIYAGPGLKGIPRGTVKSLRLFAFHFAYRNMGGHLSVGIDGPWDVHRILGTVPVYDDGSALFRIPAETPISIQPLDAEGKAVQLMRSWLTAMPGETLSCVGCHESQNSVPRMTGAKAAVSEPSEIKPWYGPARGFSFDREVQPVLDANCVGCHGGKPLPDGRTLPDLRGKAQRTDYAGKFSPAYEVLHRYVRRPGPESDYHLLPPMEYHADTSELVQMLQKGHHGVQLDAEAWDRIITWIDLNVPCHGTWQEQRSIPHEGDQRRRELKLLYANLDDQSETVPEAPPSETAKLDPAALAARVARPTPGSLPVATGWPLSAAEAGQRQAALRETTRRVDLGNGVALELVALPAGELLMGDPAGCADERPVTRTKIDKPFWMAKFEVTNEQFALFDPSHDSRYISQTNKDQSNRGYPVNGAKQPVVRVSWQQALAFCDWLSKKTGQRFSLPTEAQWEYACRAGSATPLFYGDLDSDFSPYANLADATLKSYTRRDSPDWAPKDARFNDKALVTVNVGSYQPNAWGLYDMHGNAAEWTRSTFRPYPYRAEDGRNTTDPAGRKVVRGGSWYDRPFRCRSAFRLSYPSWQAVYNVGFRVVCESGAEDLLIASRPD